MERENLEYKKGLWTAAEDDILLEYVKNHGKGQWNSISKRTGLKRCGKSCRLRWMNYLNPGIKRGHFSEEEEDLIIRLHRLLGNRWSLIAGRVPGRTDNQIKNYWNTHLSKKLGIKRDARRQLAVGIKTSISKNSVVSSEFDQTSENLSSRVTVKYPSDDSIDQVPVIDAEPHFATTSMSSEGYMTNSSLWVSEFDGLIGQSGANPSCFMDLICGNSFSLDWNHL